MGGCYVVAAVCPYLFLYTDINFRSFPRSFPHAMCDVMVGSLPHFFWVTICQGRVRVAWPISFLFTNTIAHFQSTHPQKPKTTSGSMTFFVLSTLFKCIPNSHPGNPRTPLKCTYMSCGGPRGIIEAMCPRPHCIRYLQFKSHSVIDSEWARVMRVRYFPATTAAVATAPNNRRPLDPYRLWPFLFSFSHQLKHTPFFPLYFFLQYTLLDTVHTIPFSILLFSLAIIFVSLFKPTYLPAFF